MRHPRLVALLTTVLAAMTCLLAVSGPAHAGTGLYYSAVNPDNDGTSGIYLRNGPDMNQVTRDRAHYMPYGTRLELICGAWGSAVGPNANRRWHRVRVASGAITNAQGWIADRYTNTPNAANRATPGEPECGSASSAPQPAPAQSAPSGTYMAATQHVRFCVNTGWAACGANLGGIPTPVISANAGVSMVCWLDGSSYTYGYTTNRWFWVRSGAGEGFVSAATVRNQRSVGHCSGNKPIWAAQAAVQRYGEVAARPDDQGQFAASEWRPGPHAEWAGDCPKLPYVGWRAAGVTIPKSHAINNYYSYANAGRISGGVPPVGAVVFWKVTSYGHTAISLGNGLVVSTTGMDGDRTANTVRRYSSWSHYLGWAMPA